jgi:hypothetical protein
MGTWGTDIFDNDVALDVRTFFEDSLEGGASVERATAIALQESAEFLADEDDAPIAWLALAALQLEHGGLQRRVRDEALAVIDSGVNQRRWDEESTPEDTAERRVILAELRVRLLPSQWYE